MQLHAKGQSEKNTYTFKYATWEFNPFLVRSDFDEDFSRDPIIAERDFGANPPNAASPLVADPHRFWSAIDETAHPTAMFSITYPVDKSGLEYVGAKLASTSMDRDRPLYLFGDAGATFDQFGLIAMSAMWAPAFEKINQQDRLQARATAHLVQPDRVEALYSLPALPEEDQQKLTLVSVHEWSLRIIPEKGKPVWFESILDIITAIQQQRRIATVAFDRWNSESTLQQISNMGISAQRVTLKVQDFTKAVQDAMLGRLRLLPPADGEIYLEPSGTLRVKTSPALLSAEGAVLYEVLKLERSEDLKSVFNPRKGSVRGVDSDDLAHCLVGAHRLVQESTGIILSEQQRREQRKAKEIGGSAHFAGGLTRYTRW
jgi:hypothetical protein